MIRTLSFARLVAVLIYCGNKKALQTNEWDLLLEFNIESSYFSAHAYYEPIMNGICTYTSSSNAFNEGGFCFDEAINKLRINPALPGKIAVNKTQILEKQLL